MKVIFRLIRLVLKIFVIMFNCLIRFVIKEIDSQYILSLKKSKTF